MWQRELDDLSNKSLTGTQNTNGISGNGKVDRVGEYAARKTDIEKIIEARLLELQIARDEIIRYIDDIPNSLIRQIVFYRSCSLMKWREIAKYIGEGYTEESLRQIYSRFLRRLDAEE